MSHINRKEYKSILWACREKIRMAKARMAKAQFEIKLVRDIKGNKKGFYMSKVRKPKKP